MSSAEVAVSYVKYIKSLSCRRSRGSSSNLREQNDYILKAVPEKRPSDPGRTTDTLCVKNLNSSIKLSRKRFLKLIYSDVYDASEKVFSNLVNGLFLLKLGESVNLNLKTYRFILKVFGPVKKGPHKFRKERKYDMVLEGRNEGFKLKSRNIYQSRRYRLSVIYRLLNCCLFVKRSVWGFKISLKDILKIINYLWLYKRNGGEWDTTEILDSESELGFQTISHLLYNLLYKLNKRTDLVVSACCRWRSYSLEFLREAQVTVLFVNALNINDEINKMMEDFKKMLNISFNEFWNNLTHTNTNEAQKYLGEVRKFYVALNEESPYKERSKTYQFSHPRSCIPKNMILDDRHNLGFVRYALFVVKTMVSDPNTNNILVIIDLMVQYFSSNTLKFGFIKCIRPHKCLKCSAIFTELYLGLMEILEKMRGFNVHYAHLPLIRMLIKNEVERIKTSFFGSYYEEDMTNFIKYYNFNKSVIKDIMHRNLKTSHYPPNYSKFLKYKMCHNLLKNCINRNTTIFIKENSLSGSSKCPWYLKILFCVDKHVNQVDAKTAINKCLGKKKNLNFDHLSYRQPRKERYNSPFCNNNILVDETEIMYNLYVTKPSIHQYLEVFALNDELNVIQRTQACLVLSKNLKYVEMVLEQLVQCLVIDPGDRIINLLYISLKNHNIKKKILYHLSCLIHSNISPSTNHKINKFMQFIFELFPEDERKVYGNQILVHGQFLNLTLKLTDLPLSKRYDELNKKVKEISNTINEDSNLYLYNELDPKLVESCENELGRKNRENGSWSAEDMDNYKIVGINLNTVKILKSAARTPFMISYKLKNGGERTYIYKMMDDLRQDCLTMQMKNFLVHVFKSHQVDAFLQPYLVLPYSSVLGEMFSKSKINEVSISPLIPHMDFEIGGVVGFIPDTISRHSIGKEYGVSIKNFYLEKFGYEYSPNYVKAVHNFVTSLAGYALLSFLLQVKDRHNGNLLFTSTGHIIHIDFGFILGASPAKDLHFELAPFKLTQEMVDFMGGTNSENFRKFIHLVTNSYLALRTHSNLVITLIRLLQYSKIPCFRKSTLTKLQRRLRLNDSPSDARRYIMRKIFYALHSKTTKLYDLVQNYQQGIEH